MLSKIWVSSDERAVTIECPSCDNWENHPIDEQRHHLQSFSILEWAEDENGEPEVSLMECLCCKTKFPLTWDYENIEEGD